MSKHFVKFDRTAVEPESSSPQSDRVRSGRPSFKTWEFEGGDGVYAGIWEAAPGEWDIDYTEWEFFHILEGVSVLTEEGGDPIKLSPGDSAVIRPGFKGRWRVVEATRKHYVVKI